MVQNAGTSGCKKKPLTWQSLKNAAPVDYNTEKTARWKLHSYDTEQFLFSYMQQSYLIINKNKCGLDADFPTN